VTPTEQAQLEKEITEFSNDSPEHEKFIQIVNRIIDGGKNIHRIIHVNCGMGSYYAVCKKNFPHIEYIGYASSKKSSDLCRSHWEYESFFYRKYNTLNKVLWMDTDLLVLSIKNDPVQEIDQVLGPNFSNVVIPQIKLTQENQEEIFSALFAKGYDHNFYFVDIEKNILCLVLSRLFLPEDKENDKSI